MAHIKFNSFNPGAYNSFVPLAAKKSNGTAFKVIIGLAALGIIYWWINRPSKNESEDKLEVDKE